MALLVECLRERARRVKSVLCVGLDLEPKHVPPPFGPGQNLECMYHYGCGVIEIAAAHAAAVKPQYAFYGRWGPPGFHLLQRLVAFAKSKGLLVILDAKRADIGSTMTAYGDEVFGQIGADACTFVPYLGGTFMPPPDEDPDIWLPWLDQGRCVISMVRTSNPEAAELQDLELADGSKVYEWMAAKVKEWAEVVAERTKGRGTVGGVIGATWPEQAVRCRELVGGEVLALIPGYGEQGGGAEGAVQAVPTSDGLIAGVVNSSRGLTLKSWSGADPADIRTPNDALELVEAAVIEADQELNAALTTKIGRDPYATLA